VLLSRAGRYAMALYRPIAPNHFIASGENLKRFFLMGK
jgi:hypothetical protein